MPTTIASYGISGDLPYDYFGEYKDQGHVLALDDYTFLHYVCYEALVGGVAKAKWWCYRVDPGVPLENNQPRVTVLDSWANHGVLTSDIDFYIRSDVSVAQALANDLAENLTLLHETSSHWIATLSGCRHHGGYSEATGWFDSYTVPNTTAMHIRVIYISKSDGKVFDRFGNPGWPSKDSDITCPRGFGMVKDDPNNPVLYTNKRSTELTQPFYNGTSIVLAHPFYQEVGDSTGFFETRSGAYWYILKWSTPFDPATGAVTFPSPPRSIEEYGGVDATYLSSGEGYFYRYEQEFTADYSTWPFFPVLHWQGMVNGFWVMHISNGYHDVITDIWILTFNQNGSMVDEFWDAGNENGVWTGGGGVWTGFDYTTWPFGGPVNGRCSYKVVNNELRIFGPHIHPFAVNGETYERLYETYFNIDLSGNVIHAGTLDRSQPSAVQTDINDGAGFILSLHSFKAADGCALVFINFNGGTKYVYSLGDDSLTWSRIVERLDRGDGYTHDSLHFSDSYRSLRLLNGDGYFNLMFKPRYPTAETVQNPLVVFGPAVPPPDEEPEPEPLRAVAPNLRLQQHDRDAPRIDARDKGVQTRSQQSNPVRIYGGGNTYY